MCSCLHVFLHNVLSANHVNVLLHETLKYVKYAQECFMCTYLSGFEYKSIGNWTAHSNAPYQLQAIVIYLSFQLKLYHW